MHTMMDLQKAYELIVNKMNVWLHQLVKMLPNLALAVIAIVIGLFLSRLLKNFVRNLLKRFFHNEVVRNLFTSFVYLFAIGVTIFTALSILNLNKAVTSLLAGAGIVGLGLAFAFQDIAANFVAGVVMSFTRPIKIGDWITAGDHTGRVTDIRLRDTLIRSFNGQMVIIPNKEIFQNPIENASMLGRRKFELLVGISYNDDLNKVRELTLQVLQDLPNRCTSEAIKFYYEEFAESSINFTVRIWIDSPEPSVMLESRSEAIMRIKQAYDEHGISIPFPIRTLEWAKKPETADR